jgi:hypothetical protein
MIRLSSNQLRAAWNEPESCKRRKKSTVGANRDSADTFDRSIPFNSPQKHIRRRKKLPSFKAELKAGKFSCRPEYPLAVIEWCFAPSNALRYCAVFGFDISKFNERMRMEGKIH